tara:strand:+ start:22 stop:183 length:162 start_codon:yes stop_codon:yes gene_type:complete
MARQLLISEHGAKTNLLDKPVTDKILFNALSAEVSDEKLFPCIAKQSFISSEV